MTKNKQTDKRIKKTKAYTFISTPLSDKNVDVIWESEIYHTK